MERDLSKWCKGKDINDQTEKAKSSQVIEQPCKSINEKEICNNNVKTFDNAANTNAKRESYSSIVTKNGENEDAISSDKEGEIGNKTIAAQDVEALNNNESLNSDNDKWIEVRHRRAHSRNRQFDESENIKQNAEGNIREGLEIIYVLKYQQLNIPILKCRAGDNDHIEKIQPIYQNDGLTVTSSTNVDQGKDIKLCEVFDNSFVKMNDELFVIYWTQILNYVLDDKKHMIDLHGMTIKVAQAAVEFAVERERQYVKHLLGNGKRSYIKLEIISGRGVHSHGPPVLINTVEEQLQKLNCKFIRSEKNPGIFDVYVREKNNMNR